MSYSNIMATLALLVSFGALYFSVHVFQMQREYVEEEQSTRVLCNQSSLGVSNESASEPVHLHNLSHNGISLGEAKIEPNRSYIIPNEQRCWLHPKTRPIDVVECSLSLQWLAEDLDRKRFVFCRWEQRALGRSDGTLEFLWTEPHLVEERYASEQMQLENFDPKRYTNPIKNADGEPIETNPPKTVSAP